MRNSKAVDLLAIKGEGMNWQQFLTEKVLKECWDADKRPGGDLPNRPYDNRNDLLDLYEVIYRDGKWVKLNTLIYLREAVGDIMQIEEYVPWLFCLNGEGYEERCKMVAEFYGWNEQRLDPVIDKNSGAYGDN